MSKLTDELGADVVASLIEAFTAEAREELELLVQEIVDLERKPSAERAPLAEQMFRRMHSLKGSATALGFGAIGTVCHAFESLLKAAASAPGNELGAAGESMLAAADWLRAAILAPESASEPEGERLAAQLAAVASKKPTHPEPEPAPEPPIPEARSPTPPESSAGEAVRVPIALVENLAGETDALLLLTLRCKKLALEADAIQLQVDRACMRLDPGHPARAELSESRRQLDRLQRQLSGVAHDVECSLGALRDQIAEMRMAPLATAIAPLKRIARDLAARSGKSVHLDIAGEEIRLDKKVIELIKDPLGHLIRNAVDHGCGTPEERRAEGRPAEMTISLRAETREGSAVITVRDDGRGIDRARLVSAALRQGRLSEESAASLSEQQRLELIFSSGLSTAEQLTETSGRGVGLDVVRHNVHCLGGQVEVSSVLGKGTCFTLTLPLLISAARGLLVRAGSEGYFVPLAAVEEILALSANACASVQGRRYVALRGEPVSFAPLREVLWSDGAGPRSAYAVVLREGEARAAIGVDLVLGEQEIVIKPLPHEVAAVRGVAGMTILADRSVVAVLEAKDLIAAIARTQTRATLAEKPRKRVLIADDTATTRLLMTTLLESGGYDVEQAHDGLEALEKLRQVPCDALITDVEMPGLDGLALTRELRVSKDWGRLPVIIVSSLGTKEDLQRGSAAGADAYVVKRELAGPKLLELVASYLSPLQSS